MPVIIGLLVHGEDVEVETVEIAGPALPAQVGLLLNEEVRLADGRGHGPVGHHIGEVDAVAPVLLGFKVEAYAGANHTLCTFRSHYPLGS